MNLLGVKGNPGCVGILFGVIFFGTPHEYVDILRDDRRRNGYTCKYHHISVCIINIDANTLYISFFSG